MSRQVSQAIAEYLASRGVDRVYGLCGGHIQPIWDELPGQGIRVIDVRDERAAVHMAQAEAELTGRPGVALVTAGPGFTNALTGIANAHTSRAPVLILSGIPPRPQMGMGALQELPQAEMAGSVTRFARTVMHSRLLAVELEKAMSSCLGNFGDPGPAYLDFPTDLLRESLSGQLPSAIPSLGAACSHPADHEMDRALDMFAAASRPLIISGGGARGSAEALNELLEAWDCLYLDTPESRGLVVDSHPCFVPAVRGRAMREADLVLTVGRSLDYQLGYGSSAVFPKARFIRLGSAPAEVGGNRPGDLELTGSPPAILQTLAKGLRERQSLQDRDWLEELRLKSRQKLEEMHQSLLEQPTGSDGGIDPRFMLGWLRRIIDPGAIVVSDGGDILSFSRMIMTGYRSLDCGSFGCLGVGVPYGVAAALLHPDSQTVVISGDGSFGFGAMELETCVRHGAETLFVIANNKAWNIERNDQLQNFGGRILGSELADSDYAGFAGSLGLYAETVTDPNALAGALGRALEHLPALLDIRTTREVFSPDGLSGLAQVPSYQALNKWDELERSNLS
ncbi:MAG: thiamine pyrophosphate-binding protein [Desulfohalobiaceae bacterium]